MTKTELKYAVIATGSHFFDRASMRFFGDTIANYSLCARTESITTTGGTHTCHMLTRKRPVKNGLQSPAFFDTTTFERVHQGVNHENNRQTVKVGR